MSDYHRLRDAYDPDERCASPPEDECTQVLESVEVHFRIPVYVTSEQIQRLHHLVDEITNAPCNQPKDGPIAEAGYNGISNESLLAVVEHRLVGFQSGQFACRENAIALTKLQEAMMWLHKRTRDRMARGVEGTNQK